MNAPAIELRHVTAGYDGGPAVLSDFNARIGVGERVGLAGPNASGKSTLLHVIMGLRPVRLGDVRLHGRRCATEKAFVAARRRIGLLFQDSDDQLFCPTVMDDVAFGPLHLGRRPEEARRDALEALNTVGLTGYENRLTGRLSGGEKKLVALATNLSMRPDTLLLDEPTAFLDATSRARLLRVLIAWPGTLVVASHDRDVLDSLTTRRIMLGGMDDWPQAPVSRYRSNDIPRSRTRAERALRNPLRAGVARASCP